MNSILCGTKCTISYIETKSGKRSISIDDYFTIMRKQRKIKTIADFVRIDIRDVQESELLISQEENFTEPGISKLSKI